MHITVKRHPNKIVVAFLYDHNDENERGRAARIELELVKTVGTIACDPIPPNDGSKGFTVTVEAVRSPGNPRGSALRDFTTVERVLAGFTLKLWPVEGSDDEWIAESREAIPPQPQRELMFLDDFVMDVQDGMLTNDDGHGKYAMADWMSDEDVSPSDVTDGRINRRFTHVVWFNR